MSAIQQSAVTQITSPGNSNYDNYYSNVTLLLSMNGSNNSTSFVDASPNQKTVTANGDAKISAAQFKFGGSSASFDGNGDYLTIPSSTDLDISTGDFTIEAWVYLNAMPTTDTLSVWQNWMIIYERGSASASDGWQFQIGQTLLMFSDSYGTAVCSGTHGMVINTWYHLSVSRSGTTFRVFVNGVQVGTSTSSITLNSGPTYWIGTETGQGAYLNGYIDDLRVTKGIARYTSNFTVPTYANPLTGPQYDPFYNNVSLLLHCNGSNASTNFIDNSGSPKTVTANGNAQISTAQWKFGDSSGYFDGSGDILSISGSQDFVLTNNFTIEGWVYIDSTMVSSRPDNLKIFIFVGWNTGNTPQFYVVGTTTTAGTGIGFYDSTNDFQVAVTIPKDQWVHLAFVRTSSIIYGFVNGTRYTIASSYSTTIGTTNNVVIAGNPNQVANYYSYLKGYMDDIRITNGIARYTTNFTPPRLAFADSGPNFDPYYDQVTLLLPFNGANASTSFIDNSKTANIISVTGNTQISTAQSKFGGSSVYFDGNIDWLSLPSTNINFQSSDFTIEFWIYRTSNALGTAFSMARDQSGTGYGPVRLDFTTSLTVRPLIGDSNNTGWASTATGTATIALNTWGHYALVKSGTTITQYINGVLDLTLTSMPATFSDVSRDVTIGYNNSTDGQYLTGYLDDFRITKGVARYTTNFTPPVRPNPTTGIQYDNYYDNVSLLLHMNGPNNGTSFVDNSLRAKTVTANGNAVTSTTQYRYGVSSAYFDGNGDSLIVSASNEFDFGTDPWTIECWVRISADASGVIDVIIGNRSTSFLAGQWYLFYQSSQILFDFRVSGENNFLTATGISFDTWYHIAVVRNGTNYAMYKDGVLAQSSTISSSAPIGSSSYNISIGNSTDNSFPLNGYIDDLRITKGIARYTANFTLPTQAFPDQGPQTDPFYYNTSLLLHFDGTNTSTNFVDNSPVIKSVTPSGNAQISTAQSKFGGSSVFLDGTGDYLSASSLPDFQFGSNDFTIECWLYQTATTSYNLFTFATQQWCVYYSSGPQSLRFYDGVTDRIIGGSVTRNVWNHIALTRQGTQLRLFLNGVQTGSTYTDTGPTNLGQAILYIGYYPADVTVTGYLDDFRVTKGIARYVNNFTPPQRPFPNQ